MSDWLTAEDLWEYVSDGAVPVDKLPRLTLAIDTATLQVDRFTDTDWAEQDSIPAMVREAALLQGARLFKRREATFGIAQIASVEGNVGMRLHSKMDPDAEQLLVDWRGYASL